MYRQGRSAGGRHLVLYAFERDEDRETTTAATAAHEQGSRLGVSVGRRVGSAVERNEVKRLLREAFWEIGGELAGERDYVIVARPDSAGLVERDRIEGVRRELRELFEKLSLPVAEVTEAAAGEASEDA